MSDELITDAARIGTILDEMRQHVRVLNVRLDPEGPLYSSSVIRLDSEHKRLFLDELNPQLGHWELTQGQEIRIHASLRGVAVRFTTRIESLLSEDGIALYACPYPDKVRYLQRRETFRVHLPLGERRGIRLQHPRSGEAVIGRLIDLSAQGFCVELERDEIIKHGAGTRFIYSCVVLPSLAHPLAGEAELINVRPARDPERFAAGFRIANLDQTTERSLMRATLHYQREARRSAAET